MTRKDYVRLAAALAEGRHRIASEQEHGPVSPSLAWTLTVAALVRTLAWDNARFDEGRFWDAANEE